MKIKVTKVDSVNATVNATISKEYLQKKIDFIAKDVAKDMKSDGFRAGKVPLSVVKSRHKEKLDQEAEGAALQELLSKAIEELKIVNTDIIGEPTIPKFDKKDGAIEVEVLIALKPDVKIDGYKDIVPEVKNKKITAKEIDLRIKELSVAQAPYVDIEENRALSTDDQAVFDFEGFIDGVAFDGGKAENFSLKIGSGQFIPGFEDGMIGMKAGEEKTINVKFPDDYQADNLKGKDSEFKVKLHKIQIKKDQELNDELAAAMMPGVEGASVDKLKEQVKEQLKTEKMSKYYNDELKPKLLEELVKAYIFELPNIVVEQEIDNSLNNKVRGMSEDEINKLKEDRTAVDAMREALREESEKSVRLTFIIDAIAKVENVTVSEDEIIQTLKYEAMMYGQDGDTLVKQYQEQGLMPMIKLSMIEDRLVTKLLDNKLKDK